MDIKGIDVPELSPLEKIVDIKDGRATFFLYTFLDVVRKVLMALDEKKLEDAPIDGKQYCRKDGSWQEII